jgi:hypothetical protein
MFKLIFLDIDGVIKTDYSNDNGRDWVNPELVSRLNDIIATTGALVVISSVWRKNHTVCELREILNEAGFNGTIIGKTGNSSDGVRGHEIDDWLMNCQMRYRDAKFVILDDSSDMDQHMNRLVRTYTYEGLTDKHVDMAINMLEE